MASAGFEVYGFDMPTAPLFILVGLISLLALIALCHFYEGRQNKDHASRKGPDDV